MRYIVRCLYKDFAGAGWFAMCEDGASCSWGLTSPNVKFYDNKEEAEQVAAKVQAADDAKGFGKSQYKWHAYETASI